MCVRTSRYGMVVALVMVAIALSAAHAEATVIDTFSSSASSGAYSHVVSWDPDSTGGAAWAVDAGQFKPTDGAKSVNYYLRNDGYMFDVGSTVGINVNALSTFWDAGGLGLSKSLSSMSPAETRFFVQSIPDTGDGPAHYELNINGAKTTLPGFTLASPATLSLTRVSATTLNYALSYANGSGSTVSYTGSSGGLGAGAYYFGMMQYSYAADVGLDNLTHAIPEPSSIVLSALGLVGLLAYAWRRRK